MVELSQGTESERLDNAFFALSHPVRRRLIEKLGSGEGTVCDLAEEFEMSLNAVSKHIKILERGGLIDRKKIGREHHLRANPERVEAMSQYLEHVREFWSDRLDDLVNYFKDNPKT